MKQANISSLRNLPGSVSRAAGSSRVCQPGGRLFLAVHGQRALDRAFFEPPIRAMLDVRDDLFQAAQAQFKAGQHALILQHGQLTTVGQSPVNMILSDKAISDPFGYGITLIPEAYLRIQWSRWSDVLRQPTHVDWLTPLCGFYRCMGAAAWLVMTLALAALRRRLRMAACLMLAALGAEILARALLLGIVDATSWSGVQARYLLPVIPVFACMGALGMAMWSDLLAEWRNKAGGANLPVDHNSQKKVGTP